jgi:fatty acid desaturase
MLSLRLRYKDGLWPHGLALGYGVLGFGYGLALSAAPAVLANLLGIVLLSHAMVISAYLIHECAHNTVFAANRHNALLGACLSWITGSCYARFEDLRRKHFRHHVERADVIRFDYRRRIIKRPLLAKLLAALEWAYIPAVEIMLHGLVVLMPFIDAYYKPQRKRVLLILAVRTALFAALAWYAPRLLLCYPVAYMLFLIVLRFMDANQHTYDLIETHDEAPLPNSERRDRRYEFQHTYSNPISMRFPLLNLITLNFAYHNAHHERPTVPWYRLPALHRELFGDERSHVLPFRGLIRAHHRHRVERAFRPLPTDMHSHVDRGPDLQGIDGISFLIPI